MKHYKQSQNIQKHSKIDNQNTTNDKKKPKKPKKTTNKNKTVAKHTKKTKKTTNKNKNDTKSKSNKHAFWCFL